MTRIERPSLIGPQSKSIETGTREAEYAAFPDPELTSAIRAGVPDARHIVLVGLMGSGKSTVGRELAGRLDRPFLDNDDMLFRRSGRQARDIERDDGVDTLHRLEAEVLVAALASSEAAVIGAAAASVLEPGVAAVLADHEVVYLRAPVDVLVERISHEVDDGHRPFITTSDLREMFAAQFATRDPIYQSLATIVVDDTRPPTAVADAIMSAR